MGLAEPEVSTGTGLVRGRIEHGNAVSVAEKSAAEVGGIATHRAAGQICGAVMVRQTATNASGVATDGAAS